MLFVAEAAVELHNAFPLCLSSLRKIWSFCVRLVQRKLIWIDSNLRRHCLIRKILSSKYTFRWREFTRCHSIISCFPLVWYVRQPAALAECRWRVYFYSWGISIWKCSALVCRRWSHRKSHLFLLVRRPQSHHMYDPRLSASACIFLRCWYHTSHSPGNEINLLGMSGRGKILGSHCDMLQSAFATSDVNFHTCHHQDTGVPPY